jgi:hypothetical protein
MSNKDDITIDDIAIDLGDYDAQESTMIDSLDTITITGSGLDQYSSANSSNFTYGGATVGGITTATLPSASTYTIGAAGTRARKALQEVAKGVKARRNEITEEKNARKEAKA